MAMTQEEYDKRQGDLVEALAQLFISTGKTLSAETVPAGFLLARAEAAAFSAQLFKENDWSAWLDGLRPQARQWSPSTTTRVEKGTEELRELREVLRELCAIWERDLKKTRSAAEESSLATLTLYSLIAQVLHPPDTGDSMAEYLRALLPLPPLPECPFCGHLGPDMMGEDGCYYVACPECSSEGPTADTEKEAAEKWSARGKKVVDKAED